MSDARREKACDHGGLGNLTSERLLKLMRDAFLADGDSGYLDMLTDEYMSRLDAPAIDVGTAWQNFLIAADGGEFKYAVAVAENHAQTGRAILPHRRARRTARVNGRALRVTIAAALAASLLFALATAAGAFPAVGGAIAKWTHSVFTFTRDPSSGITTDLRGALAANGITAPLAPRWVPDGYELVSADVVENELWTDYTYVYTMSTG
jgi:hypothetical protein